MFHPDLKWVDITGANPKPEIGWTYDGSAFGPPPGPTPEEILATNTMTRDALLREAGIRIAPLQDAVDLGMATEAEQSQLLAWKQYRVTLNRLDLAEAMVIWPATPEA
ncbi:tail fiber assembly protein [Cupriavidus gilardii]|nr:tail fiber assembly protein [Cupriavidus gilardii]